MAGTSNEQIQKLKLKEMYPFKEHPFKVEDDTAMLETAESIRRSGVLVPGIVRERPEGGYEIVSGHRRHRACELAKCTTMPVIVRKLDDNEATIIMVDSNMHREKLLPSERAFAYKMRHEAMKKKTQKALINSGEPWKRTDQLLADQTGQSRAQVQRYIRLTHLIPELLELTDKEKIALSPAVELSFLKMTEQQLLLAAIDYADAMPSLKQAKSMKELSRLDKLTLERMEKIMIAPQRKQVESFTLSRDDLTEYFPSSYTSQQISNVIRGLLNNWKEQHRQKEQAR